MKKQPKGLTIVWQTDLREMQLPIKVNLAREQTAYFKTQSRTTAQSEET